MGDIIAVRQAIAHQTDIYRPIGLQQTMAELTDTLKALAGGGGPQDKAAKQAELLKATYERAVANTREMGELIQKANGEALGALNSRVAEALDELRDLVKQTKG